MRPSHALPVCILAGCGFRITGGVSGDAPPTGEAGIDVPADIDDGDIDAPDAPAMPADAMIGPGGCLSPKVWDAEFDVDPRTLDVNADAVPDWTLRGLDASSMFPGTLVGGVWLESAPPIQALDTQPKQNFTTRTRITLRMRHAAASANGDAYGAVFWINVGFGDTDFAPLWLALTRIGVAQQVVLYTKNSQQAPIELDRRNNLGTGMQDMIMIVDPAAHSVSLTAGLSTSQSTYTEIDSTGNDDRFATIAAWSSPAELDRVKIEVCP